MVKELLKTGTPKMQHWKTLEENMASVEQHNERNQSVKLQLTDMSKTYLRQIHWCQGLFFGLI